ncbi:PREDICTED: echinoderm microtubule-associated protein-like 2 [Ceratosolen solmsi marchali]|uniref:Echinoderm microtubule-associated protein-like 2 n=1 Tax=Ceratosolen solmsi marchali TaxID=326594 RepID=A0AAJ7E2V1_9HYME|nr:PREDICTED: echinoderm microtubule-associated protein-like 2 [Ceratosolen solmsi marchali]
MSEAMKRVATREEVERAWHEMLECEASSILQRVVDLERQSLAQKDEIICLRATLADALRRIDQLKSRDERNDRTDRGERRNDRGISSPLRNGHISLRNQNSLKDAKGRQSSGASMGQSPHDTQRDGSSQLLVQRRPVNYATPTQLPQRLIYCQGNKRISRASGDKFLSDLIIIFIGKFNVEQFGNLNGTCQVIKKKIFQGLTAINWHVQLGEHYEIIATWTFAIKYKVYGTCNYVRGSLLQTLGTLSVDSPSSSSVSPVPSPSPRATPLPAVRSPTTRVNGPPQCSLRRAKRWSSTGDFTHSPSNQGSNNAQLAPSRLSASTKSLFNLFKPPVLSNLKHGTREMQYNEEDGTIRMYLRGRPVNMCVPSGAIESYDPHKVNVPPQSKLKLDWVYGYRGRDCRNNLHLLPTGEVVYFVASVVVLYNTEEHCQRHYLGHTDDVKCIAIHPNKLVVATGQASGAERRDTMAHVRIWNSVSLSTLCTIGNGEFDGSICCLSFSKADGGNFLATIDETSDHNISIWEWQKGDRGTKLTETKCSVDTVVCAEWHPLERTQIVSCGKGHVSFWSLDNGGMLYKRMGLFESREKPRYVTCVAFNQSGDVLTGDSNGNVIVWARGTNTIAKLIRNLHEGSVFSMCVLKDGNIITGGGKDGRIVLLDASLNPMGLEAQIEDHFGGIRTVAEGRGNQLLVGTTRNCILLGDLEMGFSPAMLGHAEEVWGLAAHPILPQFATAGHDRLLQMWDSLSHTVVWSKDIGEQAQSVCFSPDGAIMVVGCLSGKWLAIDSETRELYSYHSDGTEPLQVVKFSPDGTLLALGSRDNNIYIYQVNEEATKYNRVGRCMGHSNVITHLDWSLHGQYLRSNSGDYELLYWNAGVCRQISQGSLLKDIDWATHSCVISFETVGIWPDGPDGVDINICNRSGDGKLLATGDESGKVKLFSYPACQPKSLYHSYSGHSNHVTEVSFLQDDTRLVSSGGSDTSVLQWVVN